MQAQARVRTSQITLIVLTAITALIHFERAIQDRIPTSGFCSS